MIGYNEMVVRRDNEVRQVENPLPDLILDEIPQQCIDKWILILQLKYIYVNIKFLKQPKYKNWLGCSDNPADNKLYCRVCKYFMQNPPEGLVIPHRPRDIAQKGVIGFTKRITTDYLHGHILTISKGKPDATGIFHHSAVKFAETNEIDCSGLESTRDMLFVVYAESRLPVKFEQHPTLFEAIKLLNLNLGKHHIFLGFTKALKPELVCTMYSLKILTT
jgi:hypothetical protein